MRAIVGEEIGGDGRCDGIRGYRRGAPGISIVRLDLRFLEPRLHLVAGEQLDHACAIGCARREFVERLRQLRQVEIAAHGDELAPERQEVERGAQVLADHAADVTGGGDDAVERVVLRQPLDRRLRSNLGDARNVVDRVADQRQVVDDALGWHAELGKHAGGVERFVAHRVDQRHAFVDELRQILVAGRDHDVDALCSGLSRQRADHIVGLDAVDHQDRPAAGGDAGVDRLDLQAQVVGHRRPVGLVFGVPVVAEGLALGVENAGLVGHIRCLVVTIQPA